jgi:hypothetical protein
LAYRDHVHLFQQLSDSKAFIEFNGGLDIRYLSDNTIEMLSKIKVREYHFAWDDPGEDLFDKFKMFANSGLKNPSQVGVYVLVNYWSDFKQDLERIYKLRSLGFMPFVMIYDKQKFVNDRGLWLPNVGNEFTHDQLIHFKKCQHLQRWSNNRKLIKISPNFENYDQYINWVLKGCQVPLSNIDKGYNQLVINA